MGTWLKDLPQCLRNYSRCMEKKYSITSSASVIIAFRNEGLSVLLRTITGIINRTPKALLREIILIDDKSDKGKFDDVFFYYELWITQVRLFVYK